MHLCTYVVDSIAKQSKEWTLGVLADARGYPENTRVGNSLCPQHDIQIYTA